MARKQKLKVYRTPIGFHDAYVAAPSQKAALAAWGANVDLFARGVAEVVHDETLAQAPLDAPGSVIRTLRGTADEHIAALPVDRPHRRLPTANPESDEGPSRRRTARPVVEVKSKAEETKAKDRPSKAPLTKARRPKPRPSRARLDKAEQALEASRSSHERTVVEIRRQEKALQEKRRALEAHHEQVLSKLEAGVEKARTAYAAALEKWRA